MNEQLFSAAEFGDLSKVEEILPMFGDVDVQDVCYWVPLMKAALNGHVDIVSQLLNGGADIEKQDKGGYTPLMLAASNNHPAVLRLLIARGANIDHVENTRGWARMALIWVITRGHAEMAELLQEHVQMHHSGETMEKVPWTG